MPYILDPEIAAAFATFATQLAAVPAPARGDWKALREMGEAMAAQWASSCPIQAGIDKRDTYVTSEDGTAIRMRWYAKAGVSTGAAVLYAHGGGMVLGGVDAYDPIVSAYVEATGIPFLSVEYRLAPEAQGETPARDVFAGLLWLHEQAAALGVDPFRIAVMGDSAGGGLAAAAAILARERGVELARQILVYPMLDDRNVSADPHIGGFVVWTHDNNFTGWTALLGEARGAPEVSPIAAPARLADFAGLAAAYVEVGELDIFRNEDIAYAQRLSHAGVPVELHVHPGAPHDFTRFAPDAEVSRRAMADRFRVLRSL